MDCDFLVPVCSKVMQVFKRPSEVTAFSLFLSLCHAATLPGPRDTYITGPWQLHTYTNRQRHTEWWLQAFCCWVLVYWSSSLLKDNKGDASHTGCQSAAVCFPVTLQAVTQAELIWECLSIHSKNKILMRHKTNKQKNMAPPLKSYSHHDISIIKGTRYTIYLPHNLWIQLDGSFSTLMQQSKSQTQTLFPTSHYCYHVFMPFEILFFSASYTRMESVAIKI